MTANSTDFPSQAVGYLDDDGREIALLWKVGVAVIAYLCLLCAGAAVAAVLLVGHSRTNDLQRVGALALLGGALGALVSGVFVTAGRLQRGFELRDGRIVEWGKIRRARAEEAWRREHGAEPARHSSRRAAESAVDPRVSAWEERDRQREQEREHERRLLDAEFASYRLFGMRILPELLIVPVIGATLGLSAFAGVVGGFLVASGSDKPTYSPTGLLFVAFLAGLFADKFIQA